MDNLWFECSTIWDQTTEVIPAKPADVEDGWSSFQDNVGIKRVTFVDLGKKIQWPRDRNLHPVYSLT